MPDTPTQNLQLIIPTVGGDDGSWGTETNENWETVDALGSFAPNVYIANANVVAGSNPITIAYAFGGAAGITLQLQPGSVKGIFTVKKMDATIGAVIVDAPVGLFDGQPNYVLTNQFQFVSVHFDGANWNVIGAN